MKILRYDADMHAKQLTSAPLLVITFLTGILFILTACTSTPSQTDVTATADGERTTVPTVTAEPSAREQAAKEPEDTTTILRHKGSEAGLDILPVWVEAYLTGGTEAVEALPDFADAECYVSEAAAPTLEEGYRMALSDIPSAGARQVSGWWMLVHRADARENYFSVYVLYTVPRDTRDRHTAVN